jgi:CheY-like chemotaxis protein
MASILIVDDDSETCEPILLFLRRSGHTVECCGNGREALTHLLNRLPDAVLLDLMMPEMDGFQFVTELRKQDSGPDATPIIVVTAKEITAEDRTRLAGKITQIVSKGGDPLHPEQSVLKEIRDLVAAYL